MSVHGKLMNPHVSAIIAAYNRSAITRDAIAWLRPSALVALVALFVGCTAVRNYVFPTDDYVAVGEPTQSFEAAKAVCLEETEFTSGFSEYQGHNWNRFEACMGERGWARPSE